jgi:hypothetical protein
MFQKFNTAFGTLTQVDLSISAGLMSIIKLENKDIIASQGGAWTHLRLTVTDPNSLLSLIMDLNSMAYPYTLSPGQVIFTNPLLNIGTDSGSWTNEPILTEFTGAGDIGIDVGSFSESLLNNTGGHTVSSDVTTWNATGTVTYYYDAPPVPEPVTILAALSILGPAGILFRRRK